MIFFTRFIKMLRFFTKIPIPWGGKETPEDYGKGLIFAPIAGLIIGDFLAAIYYLLGFVLPSYVVVALVLAAYILVTGGLHFDGLADTFDGVFSGRSKSRILEIMRDSRVGTNALLAVSTVLILDGLLLFAVDGKYIMPVLLLMPVAGRIASLIGAGTSKYARDEGLGKSFIENAGPKEVIIGLIIYFAIFGLTAGLNGLLIAVIPPVTAFIAVKFFSRKIGGATGDILGAAVEINQTLFLLAVCILQKFAF